MRRLTLLVNADNTLWESNVFFENTLERFFSLVEPFGYARAYARHILNETERQNIQQHGYGVRSFARSLEQSYKKLAGGLAQRMGGSLELSPDAPSGARFQLQLPTAVGVGAEEPTPR